MVMERLKIDLPSEGPFREQMLLLYQRIVNYTILHLDGTTMLDASDIDEEYTRLIALKVFKAVWKEDY